MKRALRWRFVICAAALGVSSCQGGGAQGSLLPGGGPNSAIAALGNGPGGATLLRVHVPWTITTAGSSGANPAPLPTAMPMFPGTTPTPMPTFAPAPSGSAVPGGQVQAVVLNVSGPTPTTASIPITSAGQCVNVGGGAVCQAALSLQPGSYTALVTLYGTSNAAPSSQLGSAQTIAFGVGYGAPNVVNVTLSGTVAQVDVAPGSSLSGENAQGGIDLYGGGKHVLIAQLLDAAGNIVLVAGTPSISIAQSGGTLGLTVNQPSGSAPNAFTVTPATTYAGGAATLRVVANFSGQNGNPCTQAGANCSGTMAIDVRQLLAVANASANTVTLYAGGQPLPVATLSGVTAPQALVFDAAGDLFVASQPGSVAEYSPPFTGSASTIAIGVSHPQALALDARGNLFVANGSASNTVTEYSPPYGGAPIATISNGVDDPVSVAVDASGSLFVANQSANSVTVYGAPYTGAPIALTNGLNGPNSIAIDGRGNVFVSNLNSTPNSVVQFVPPLSASSTPAVTISSGVNEQGAIGLSPSAGLFVPNQGANTVTQYAAPYAGAPTTIAGGQSQPVALAIDAQSNLYVANYGNSTVTIYTPPYAGVSWLTLSNGIGTPQALALSPPTSAMMP